MEVVDDVRRQSSEALWLVFRNGDHPHLGRHACSDARDGVLEHDALPWRSPEPFSRAQENVGSRFWLRDVNSAHQDVEGMAHGDLIEHGVDEVGGRGGGYRQAHPSRSGRADELFASGLEVDFGLSSHEVPLKQSDSFLDADRQPELFSHRGDDVLEALAHAAACPIFAPFYAVSVSEGLLDAPPDGLAVDNEAIHVEDEGVILSDRHDGIVPARMCLAQSARTDHAI